MTKEEAWWLELVRQAVRRGVRCDVALTGMPLLVVHGKRRTVTRVARGRKRS